jgi:hypothetical protein
VARGNYRRAVETIALNDEPLDLDEDSVRGFISVQIIAAHV